jgi:selT/selW/selH-like putative selenoprotein
LSADLSSAFDVQVIIKRGHSGIFDVLLNGKLIFSKDELGRFPEDGEIVEIIEERASR